MACLQYFVVKYPLNVSGSDVDIIQWEQSFNCVGHYDSHGYIFEQFIRQAISIPSKPIIVFSESDMPNWSSKDCDAAIKST